MILNEKNLDEWQKLSVGDTITVTPELLELFASSRISLNQHEPSQDLCESDENKTVFDDDVPPISEDEVNNELETVYRRGEQAKRTDDSQQITVDDEPMPLASAESAENDEFVLNDAIKNFNGFDEIVPDDTFDDDDIKLDAETPNEQNDQAQLSLSNDGFKLTVDNKALWDLIKDAGKEEDFYETAEILETDPEDLLKDDFIRSYLDL